MKKLFILFGLSLFICQANAQRNEPIEIINGRYYHSDIKIGYGTIKKIVEDVPAAYQMVKSGRSRITWSYIIVGLGGGMLGSSLGTLMTQGSDAESDPVTGIIVGVAFGAGGTLLAISGSKRVYKGVTIYNSSLDQGYIPDRVSVNFGVTQHGLGFTCRF